MEIDFGEAWDFLDDAGRPRHLRFRRNLAPPGDPGVFAETGQLVAVIGDAGRPDNYDEIAISRPDGAVAGQPTMNETPDRPGFGDLLHQRE